MVEAVLSGGICANEQHSLMDSHALHAQQRAMAAMLHATYVLARRMVAMRNQSEQAPAPAMNQQKTSGLPDSEKVNKLLY
jgi:methylphosphotriester-DNA--protein-cysteine methyltransferase